jgi:hypothetical protein
MTKTIEPPCVSDGIEAKRSNAPPEVIENVLKRLGKNLYEYRTGKTRRLLLN